MIIRFMSFGKGRIPSIFSLNILSGSGAKKHRVRDKVRILIRCMCNTQAVNLIKNRFVSSIKKTEQVTGTYGLPVSQQEWSSCFASKP